MQTKPTPRKGDNPIPLLKLCLGLTALGAVLWLIGAGIAGYTLGSPPLGSGDASCYSVMRADFFIPMWKAADASTCPQPTYGP